MPVRDCKRLFTHISDRMREYGEKAGTGRITAGISGGVDSALVSALAVNAVGAENFTGVFTGINSSLTSFGQANRVAKAVGFKLVQLDVSRNFDRLVDETMRGLRDALGSDVSSTCESRYAKDPLVGGSFRSCLRAPILRFVNRLMGGGIVHGTGNEDEDRFLRFFQKGGDGEVDCNPFAFLSKGEVRQLALYAGIPKEVVTCTPTPDLWGAAVTHSDEDELAKLSGVPWTYSTVDPDTGQYTSVGTIERMSRLLDFDIVDVHYLDGVVQTFEDVLFSDGVAQTEEAVGCLLGRERTVRDVGLTMEHVVSAKRWERVTRHKMNPNCPTLSTRHELLAVKILTDYTANTILPMDL